MDMSRRPKKFTESRAWQVAMIALGWLLIVSAPLISWLPGPGGLLFFILGFGLILKNSAWAKRQYTKHSKRHPEYGEWVNWALRRKRFRTRPPFPPVRRDFMRLFRRDDAKLPKI
jgi:hypothetical protein